MVQFLLLTVVLSAAPYPKADLLVEAAELPKVVGACILDVRGQKKYAAGHIPGAVWINVTSWDRAFINEPSPDVWSKRLGEAGIDGRGPVVVCGEEDIRDAARIWWILRYWGIDQARLLNGGFIGWVEAGGKPSLEETKPVAKPLTLKARPDRLATKDELLQGLKGKPSQLIDTRSEGEHCGVTTTAQRNGAIPGAIHLEWTECLDPKTKRFKTFEQLAQLLNERHIDVNKPAVTYCQSGGRAAVVAFALELMGGPQVKNYYRSWSEWGNTDDTPIQKVTPKKK